MNKLLEMLRLARVRKGYSQEYLAGIMGVSSSRVSRWETGKTEMNLQQIHVFATKVGISPSKLFGFLARNGQAEPTPIAEIHIEVFTEEAFKKLSQVVHELGMEHVTISTKRLTVWK